MKKFRASTKTSFVVLVCLAPVMQCFSFSSRHVRFDLSPQLLSFGKGPGKFGYVQANSEMCMSEPSTPTSTNKKLSKRAERKRAERSKKFKQRGTKKPSRPKGKNVYKLHSTAVSVLTVNSTAQDVIRAIKRAQVRKFRYSGI